MKETPSPMVTRYPNSHPVAIFPRRSLLRFTLISNWMRSRLVRLVPNAEAAGYLEYRALENRAFHHAPIRLYVRYLQSATPAFGNAFLKSSSSEIRYRLVFDSVAASLPRFVAEAASSAAARSGEFRPRARGAPPNINHALLRTPGVRRTRICFSPLTKLDLSRETSPISSAFGARFTSSSSMMLISIRARFRAEAVVLPGATSSNASRALSSCRAFRPAGMTRRTYLDRADPCQRRTFGESDRLVEVAHVDQHKATELFLGLGEGAIGG